MKVNYTVIEKLNMIMAAKVFWNECLEFSETLFDSERF